MIITNVEELRDPFILFDSGVYYLYGTGVVGNDWDNTTWTCYVNDSGSLYGEWKKTEGLIYEKPKYAEKQLWAPEVHKYNGKYYMLASYYSSKTKHRGSSVLSSTSPTGPFLEISDGHITPCDKDCIDATFYLDKKGQPWLVFTREWTCTDDGIGRFDAAKVSDDLTHLTSEPIELFRADSPLWTDKQITDGCFMHTLSNGHLIMTWSNLEKDGYAIGIAHSESDNIVGPWVQEETAFFKKDLLDQHDGGHGMIFADQDGKQYICCHSPNMPCDECKERTILIPINEKDNTICIG